MINVLDPVINTTQRWLNPPVGIVLETGLDYYGTPACYVAWSEIRLKGCTLLPYCTCELLKDLAVVDVDSQQVFDPAKFEPAVRWWLSWVIEKADLTDCGLRTVRSSTSDTRRKR